MGITRPPSKPNRSLRSSSTTCEQPVTTSAESQGPAHPCADQRRLVEDTVVVGEGLAVRGHHEGGAGEMGEQDGVQAVGSEALHVEDARSEVAVGTPPGAGGGRKGQQETQDRSQRPRWQRGGQVPHLDPVDDLNAESLTSVDGPDDDVMASRTELAGHAAHVLLDAAGMGEVRRGHQRDTMGPARDTRLVRRLGGSRERRHHSDPAARRPIQRLQSARSSLADLSITRPSYRLHPTRTHGLFDRRDHLQPGQVLEVTTQRERRE